jgi:hypothetical protein
MVIVIKKRIKNRFLKSIDYSTLMSTYSSLFFDSASLIILLTSFSKESLTFKASAVNYTIASCMFLLSIFD